MRITVYVGWLMAALGLAMAVGGAVAGGPAAFGLVGGGLAIAAADAFFGGLR